MSQGSSNSSNLQEVPSTPDRRTTPVNLPPAPVMRTVEFVDLRDDDDDVIMNPSRRYANVFDDEIVDSGYATPPPE